MKRPIESDYTSQVAYTRALEAYCDTLAQPEPAIIGSYLEKDKEQEPVAWRAPNWGHGDDEWVYRDFDDPVLIADGKPSPNNEALYTTPPQRKPLSDEEIDAIDQSMCGDREFYTVFARAIEAAHGIK